MSKEYRVVFELDEQGAWIVHVPEVPGCHTYGRSLAQARNRIREALGLWVDDADSATLRDEVRLPSQIRRAVDHSLASQRQAEKQRKRATDSTARAAELLTDRLGLSVRDAAELLGLSHQRIHQIVNGGSAGLASATGPQAKEGPQ